MLIRLLVLFTLLVTGLSYGETMIFVVDDPGGRNTVTFTSKAPIENIVGTTNAVTGSVTYDPSDMRQPVKAQISVDLREVNTGIDMRDKHMRSADYLNTDGYPIATFTLNDLIAANATSMSSSDPVEVKLKGIFALHGIEREIEVSGKATFMKEVSGLIDFGYPGDMLNFDGDFTIKMQDYGIKRPEMLFLKLSETIDIQLNFTATTGRGSLAGKN